jgi:hypothetical protein
MPILKLDLDSETYGRLVEQADSERRPVVWQAEVALRRALRLPFPHRQESKPRGDAPAGSAPLLGRPEQAEDARRV